MGDQARMPGVRGSRARQGACGSPTCQGGERDAHQGRQQRGQASGHDCPAYQKNEELVAKAKAAEKLKDVPSKADDAEASKGDGAVECEELDRKIAHWEETLRSGETHKMADSVLSNYRSELQKLREERASLLPGHDQLERADKRIERAAEDLRKAEDRLKSLQE